MTTEPQVASTTQRVASQTPAPATPRRTRSQIGKANNRKGKDRELRVVAFLRVNGFPGAERMVRTGYRNSGRVSPDCGDITGTPGIAWQVKDIAEREWYKIPRILADTENQAKAANADFGVLVIRRPGHAHPSEWWAHMHLDDLAQLVAGDPPPPRRPLLHFPVRFELGELIPILRAAGYGTPLDNAEAPAPPSRARDICVSEHPQAEVTP